MNVSITGTQANGLGMVIVGGYKEGEEFGIFVKSVRPNGPVARDGQSDYAGYYVFSLLHAVRPHNHHWVHCLLRY